MNGERSTSSAPASNARSSSAGSSSALIHRTRTPGSSLGPSAPVRSARSARSAFAGSRRREDKEVELGVRGPRGKLVGPRDPQQPVAVKRQLVCD
jgi:hypothetical protein